MLELTWGVPVKRGGPVLVLDDDVDVVLAVEEVDVKDVAAFC